MGRRHRLRRGPRAKKDTVGQTYTPVDPYLQEDRDLDLKRCLPHRCHCCSYSLSSLARTLSYPEAIVYPDPPLLTDNVTDR